MLLTVCLGIMAAIFLADLLLKNAVERMEFPPEGERKLLGGRLLLCRHHNRGVMLNFAEKKQRLVAAISVVFAVMITGVFLFSFGKHGNNLLRIGLSVLLGGAFSNTYDRLKRKYVVDYLSFGVGWKWLRNLIFNLSDFCILIGALLTVLGSLQ